MVGRLDGSNLCFFSLLLLCAAPTTMIEGYCCDVARVTADICASIHLLHVSPVKHAVATMSATCNMVSNGHTSTQAHSAGDCLITSSKTEVLGGDSTKNNFDGWTADGAGALMSCTRCATRHRQCGSMQLLCTRAPLAAFRCCNGLCAAQHGGVCVFRPLAEQC